MAIIFLTGFHLVNIKQKLKTSPKTGLVSFHMAQIISLAEFIGTKASTRPLQGCQQLPSIDY
jgi:hypothetical protein